MEEKSKGRNPVDPNNKKNNPESKNPQQKKRVTRWDTRKQRGGKYSTDDLLYDLRKEKKEAKKEKKGAGREKELAQEKTRFGKFKSRSAGLRLGNESGHFPGILSGLRKSKSSVFLRKKKRGSESTSSTSSDSPFDSKRNSADDSNEKPRTGELSGESGDNSNIESLQLN